MNCVIGDGFSHIECGIFAAFAMACPPWWGESVWPPATVGRLRPDAGPRTNREITSPIVVSVGG